MSRLRKHGTERVLPSPDVGCRMLSIKKVMCLEVTVTLEPQDNKG